jgi:lipoyl(octanoyl) transferase
MIWRFIDSGFRTGSYNMDFDLILARNLKHGEAILRFYRWRPFCISLGANQSEMSLNLEKTVADKIDVVKRPTGGRAILHSEELTYSVIFPVDNLFSMKELYSEINLAIKTGLLLFDSKLKEISLEHNQPHFPSFYKEEKSAVCFAVSAKYEINYHGKKLVGSAQRKIGNVILQHGSILCGDYHKKIADYLAVNKKTFSEICDNLRESTTDLKEVLNKEINVDRLKLSIKKGFEDYLNICFEQRENEFDMALLLN